MTTTLQSRKSEPKITLKIYGTKQLIFSPLVKTVQKYYKELDPKKTARPEAGRS